MRGAVALAVCLGLEFPFARFSDQPPHFSGESPGEHLPSIAELLVSTQNGGGFVAGVDHAILATGIAAAAVLFPRSVIDEFLEGRMMRISHQITRAFPAARVVSRVAPGGTH